MKKTIITLLIVLAIAGLGTAAGLQIRRAMQAQQNNDLQGAEYLAQGPVAAWRLVCDGMVDPVGGKIEIVSQVSGVIENLAVTEGQAVKRGDVLATVDADRQKADLRIAKAELELAGARLRQLEVGTGAEELAASRAKVKSAEEELAYGQSELKRLESLSAESVISPDEYEAKRQSVRALESKVEGLRKEADAMKRGAFAEELTTAEAEVDAAQARVKRAELEVEKATVHAPSDGVVMEIHRHAGDFVQASSETPILSFSNTDHLQIRAEVVGGDVYEIYPGLAGRFSIVGVQGEKSGKLRVNRILPDFQQRRMFIPDTRMPIDARTTVALCDIEDASFPVYPGQRVTVFFVYSQRDQDKADSSDAGETSPNPDSPGTQTGSDHESGGDPAQGNPDAAKVSAPISESGSAEMISGIDTTEGRVAGNPAPAAEMPVPAPENETSFGQISAI